LSVFLAVIFSVLGLAASVYVKQIVDVVLEQKNEMLLLNLSLIMVSILVLQFTTGFIKHLLVLKTAQSIDSKMILGYYDHLIHLPQTFFDGMQTGEMVSRINDAVRINVFINEVAINMIVDSLIVMFSVMLMFYYSWKLALIALVMIPLFGFLYFISDRINKAWQRKIMQSFAVLESQLVESLNAVNTIKKLSLEKHALGQLKEKFNHLLRITRKLSIKQLYIQHSTDFITRLFTIITLWAGCYLVFHEEVSKGELLSFYALIGYFAGPVLYLVSSNRHIRDASIAADRLFEILDLETEQTASEENIPFTPGDIAFINVCFAYGHGERILNGLNLDIPFGKITGIRGASGSGKSTIMALLLKLYEPGEGRIMINGNDLAAMNCKSVRDLISVVPQHTDLFSASVKDNIVMEMKFEQEKLFDISSRLAITDFVLNMPDGWESQINHGNLSGGQKQKISVARALYRNAPILILDEPTSSLDRESENAIMQTIEWYNSKGNTVIIIAHHESSLKICDNIVNLKNGQIA
jgi:ABC-type bacteriocin/lantibiotic exporter with double-glycine peptidase domain